MKTLQTLLLTCIFSIAVMLTPAKAVTTLADLTGGATLSYSPITFSDFSVISQTGDITVPFNYIGVSLQIPNPDEIGLQFQTLVWVLNAADQTYNFSVRFKVTTTGSNIVGDTFSIAGTEGYVSVTATVDSLTSVLLASSTATHTPDKTSTSSVYSSGESSFWVNQTISLHTDATNP